MAEILIIVFTSKTPTTICISTFERTMKSSLVSSSQPKSIAIGDFNNDTLLDIVVANYGTHTIGIFISQSDGNFNEQITYFTGSNSLPYSVTISDFNNDKYLDIAVANYGVNNIGIFLGIGNGSFIDFITISLGPYRPIFITIVDFNNDNQIDIVIVNAGTNSFGILLGYGNGTFQNYQIYSTGYDSFSSSVVVGYFNNDSYLDIAVVNSRTDNIGIFLGIGNGSFQDQQIYSTGIGSNSSSISTGDFNNDKQLDLIISNYGHGNIGIFFGYGNGSFQQQQTYLIASNSHPQYVSVGYLNKDTNLDIVIVDSINDQIHIIQGFGNGSFDMISTYDGISQSYPVYVALEDFNKNNQTDIVVANFGINNILILMDYFVIPSVRKTTILSRLSTAPTSVAVADVNNDNILDIVSSLGGLLYIFVGLSNGSFKEHAHYSPGATFIGQYICTEDVNNDNKTDIIIADIAISSVDVFLGEGNGNFSEIETYYTGMNSMPLWLAFGDLNHDNTLDIVSANQNSKSIGVHLGYGNGSFAPMISHMMASSNEPYSVAGGYIDSDQHLDFAVGDKRNFITIFLGYGNGTFKKEANYSTGFNSEPYYAIINDFNNDHIHDIAVSTVNTNEILIFYGYGNGSFELARKFAIGDGSVPYGIAAANFNNDKKLEIVVALWGSGQIAILTEYSAAKFNIITTMPTGSAVLPYSVAVNSSLIVTANSGTDNLNILFMSTNDSFHVEIGKNSQPEYVITCDVNNDQQLDLISVNSKSNSISVILGNNNNTFENQIIYSTGNESYPFSIVSNDLNNDTQLDLIIANQDTNEIGIFYGFKYTTFQSSNTYSNNMSLDPFGIVVSDFNNDSYLDIAVTFSSSQSIGILLGYGNDSFSNITTYTTGNNSIPCYLDIGDFNNDNKTDIAVTDSRNDKIHIFFGHGNGSFAEPMTYSTGKSSTPIGIAIRDLNNDSQLNIVVANYESNTIGIFFGYGNGSFSNVQLYSTGNNSIPFSVAIAVWQQFNWSFFW